MKILGDASFASLNQMFANIAIWSYRHKWQVMLMCCVAFGACGYLAQKVRMDNSFEAFFDESDPTYSAYNVFRDNFGSDEIIYIMFDASDSTHGVFNEQIISKIDRLGKAIDAGVPFVKKVRSITNAELMVADGDDLDIRKISDKLPLDQAQLLKFADLFRNKPLYVNNLFDREQKLGVMVVEMSRSSTDPIDQIRLDPEDGDGLENLYPQVSAAALTQILSDPEFVDIPFYLSGDVPINATYNRILDKESTSLGAICMTIIVLLLLIFFRGRVIGAVGPIVVVGLAVMVTVAFMSLMDWPIDMMFGLAPTLLITIGVADAVHIISEFLTQLRKHESREMALRDTLYVVGTPCLLTSITTAIGFLSMSMAPVKTISHLAIYISLGVLAAFFLSITLLTFFLSFIRPAKQSAGRRERPGYLSRMLNRCSQFTLNNPGICMMAFSVTVIVAGVGLKNLKVDSNYLLDFDKSVKVRKDTEHIDNTMGGMSAYAYLFDTAKEGGIKNPKFLAELDRVQSQVLGHQPLVRKATSIVDLIKDINQSFHNDDPAYYRIPESADLISQYLLVYELSGGEDLYTYVTRDFSQAVLQIRTQLTDTSELAKFEAQMQEYLNANPLYLSERSNTGMGALYLKLMTYISDSQILGFSIALTVITLLFAIIFSSVKMGLISMIPNIAPIMVVGGLMGWTGTYLDYSKLLIAPVALGIAVDDTIHMMTRFKLEFERVGDYRKAFVITFNEAGRALVITSVTLACGWSAMLMSTMEVTFWFSVLLSSTIALALLADLFVTPLLIIWAQPFGPEKEKLDGASA
ncbi:efflux RND transporter permease subunit [Ketobacter sp.]